MFAGKLGPGVVVPGLMVHDCHQRVLLVAVVGRHVRVCV